MYVKGIDGKVGAFEKSSSVHLGTRSHRFLAGFPTRVACLLHNDAHFGFILFRCRSTSILLGSLYLVKSFVGIICCMWLC